MPPGAGGGGGRNNSKLIAIISAVVAVVLVVGAGVFLVSQGGDDENDEAGKGGGSDSNSQGTEGAGGSKKKPQSTDGKMIAKMPAPEVEEQVAVPGAWATEKSFVKTSTESVVAFDAASGEQAWELPLDGELCGASQHQTKDNKTAVTFRETKSSAADCNQMMLIDLKTGKKVWQKEIPGDSPDPENITISQGTVASAWIGGSVGFRIDGGKQVWSAKESSNDCNDAGYAGGEKLLAVVECGDFGEEEFKIQELDPKTGESTKTYEVSSGVETIRVASTSPMVLVAGAGTSTPTDIMTLSGGKFTPKISLDGDRYNTPCGTEVESCHGMTVGKDKVYLSTKEHAGSREGERTNEIMAIDLKSGDTSWKSDAGKDRTIVPIQMDGETVVAYRLADYMDPGQIVGLDPASGKQTPYLNLPKSSLDYEKEYGPSTISSRGEVVFEYGKLLLPDPYVTKDKGTFVDERLLGVGFGAR
ncbi:PQQ-binding-like beta-propeller repeat protein [Streptomyces oceani]|nr:PQQ-binding-like beta-propeller repeat protein [Streptomyces oceani]